MFEYMTKSFQKYQPTFTYTYKMGELRAINIHVNKYNVHVIKKSFYGVFFPMNFPSNVLTK